MTRQNRVHGLVLVDPVSHATVRLPHHRTEAKDDTSLFILSFFLSVLSVFLPLSEIVSNRLSRKYCNFDFSVKKLKGMVDSRLMRKEAGWSCL